MFRFYQNDHCLPLIVFPILTPISIQLWGADAGCSILKNCDRDAECVDDQCQCLKGFAGDGFFCKKDVIGCNIINNCGRFAVCLLDYEEGGYRCACDRRRVSLINKPCNQSAADVTMEIPVLVRSQSSILSSTSLQMGKTFWEWWVLL